MEIVWTQQTERYVAALWIVTFQSVHNAADAFVLREHHIIHVLLEDRRQIGDSFNFEFWRIENGIIMISMY